MSVHPDLTAHRAVDACGGTHSANRSSEWNTGFDEALDAALEAVKTPDALMNELLAALVNLAGYYEAVCQNLGGTVMGKSDIASDLSEARAAILKATGDA